MSKKFPEETFLITTNTSSSRSIIPKNKNLEHAYLPLDWLFTMRRFINLINPRICILVETELWPNLISICKKNNISIIIANARLSKRTTESPSFIKQIYKKVLSDVDLILCKSNRDKENYIQLGYLNKNIKVIGNLKYADTNNTVYNNENIVNRKYVLAL